MAGKGASFPGWVGPIVGPIVGGGIGAYYYQNMPSDEQITFSIAFAAFGFVAGLIVWGFDAIAKRKARGNADASERTSGRRGGRRRSRR